MKSFFKKIYDTCLAGLLLLVPILVVIALGQKAWKGLSSVGGKIASFIGLKGPGAESITSGLTILLLLYFAGLLVRLTWILSMRHWLDYKLESYIPGYAAYRATVEAKIHGEKKVPPEPLPYKSILIKKEGGWQPAFLVEQDETGNCLVFVPEVPDPEKGKLVLVPTGSIKILAGYPPEHLQDQLKQKGKGMLRAILEKEKEQRFPTDWSAIWS